MFPLQKACQKLAPSRASDLPFLAMIKDLHVVCQSSERYRQQVCHEQFVLMPAQSRNSQRQRLVQMLIDTDSSSVKVCLLFNRSLVRVQ